MAEQRSNDEIFKDHGEKHRERKREKAAKKRGTQVAQAVIGRDSVRKVKIRNGLAITGALLVRATLFPLNKLILATDLRDAVERRLGATCLQTLRKKRKRDRAAKQSQRYSYWEAVRKSRRGLFIIDARREDEYHESHIPTAHNYHFTLSMDIPQEIMELDRETELVTYCAVGLRSGAFARKLRHAGFKHVYVLKGGCYRWANLGYPMVSDEGYLTRTVKSQHALAGILLREELKMVETQNRALSRHRHKLRVAARRMRARQYPRHFQQLYVHYKPHVASNNAVETFVPKKSQAFEMLEKREREALEEEVRQAESGSSASASGSGSGSGHKHHSIFHFNIGHRHRHHGTEATHESSDSEEESSYSTQSSYSQSQSETQYVSGTQPQYVTSTTTAAGSQQPQYVTATHPQVVSTTVSSTPTQNVTATQPQYVSTTTTQYAVGSQPQYVAAAAQPQYVKT